MLDRPNCVDCGKSSKYSIGGAWTNDGFVCGDCLVKRANENGELKKLLEQGCREGGQDYRALQAENKRLNGRLLEIHQVAGEVAPDHSPGNISPLDIMRNLYVQLEAVEWLNGRDFIDCAVGTYGDFKERHPEYRKKNKK